MHSQCDHTNLIKHSPYLIKARSHNFRLLVALRFVALLLSGVILPLILREAALLSCIAFLIVSVSFCSSQDCSSGLSLNLPCHHPILRPILSPLRINRFPCRKFLQNLTFLALVFFSSQVLRDCRVFLHLL